VGEPSHRSSDQDSFPIVNGGLASGTSAASREQPPDWPELLPIPCSKPHNFTRVGESYRDLTSSEYQAWFKPATPSTTEYTRRVTKNQNRCLRDGPAVIPLDRRTYWANAVKRLDFQQEPFNDAAEKKKERRGENRSREKEERRGANCEFFLGFPL
jgi:hypothetical protein